MKNLGLTEFNVKSTFLVDTITMSCNDTRRSIAGGYGECHELKAKALGVINPPCRNGPNHSCFLSAFYSRIV